MLTLLSESAIPRSKDWLLAEFVGLCILPSVSPSSVSAFLGEQRWVKQLKVNLATSWAHAFEVRFRKPLVEACCIQHGWSLAELVAAGLATWYVWHIGFFFWKKWEVLGGLFLPLCPCPDALNSRPRMVRHCAASFNIFLQALKAIKLARQENLFKT